MTTTDPELTRIVRVWLDEGADRLPERVLDSVLDAVPLTPQRRSWWPARRMPFMSTFARAGVVAAVIAAAALAAAMLVTVGGARPAPTVAPTAAPTAAPTSSQTASTTPSPTASAAASPDTAIDSLIDIGRILDPGDYSVAGPFLSPYAVTLPAGYHVKALEAGEASFQSNAGWVGALVPDGVFADPCKPDLPVAASTVDEFVTALSSMKGFKAEDVRQTIVGGRPATTFLLTNSIDTSAAGCRRGNLLPLFSFAGHPEGASTNGGMDELFYVVDVDGKAVFIVIDQWSSPAALEELKTIAEGIRFE